MPGPGGGSHGGGGGRSGGGFSGGGFSGGGSFGGGHHGGGFHGGFHGPHFGGGWYHRPRRYHNGGCLGNIVGIFMTPLIIILFIVFGIIWLVGDKVSVDNNTNNIINESVDVESVDIYDENTFQDYANKVYAEEFGDSTAYEDNILLVFLTEDENYYDYYYIAWVGDHIATDINYMFGNEETEFGVAVSNAITTSSYKYSLDANIAQIINTMEQNISELNAESSFTCEEEHIQVESHLTNKTSLELTEQTVNDALKSFTDSTGIPLVVVVDDISDVF